MADVYIEAMEADVALLTENLANLPSLLPVLHRLKVGAAQIGIDSIHRSALFAEAAGKSGSSSYQQTVTSLIEEVKQSIVDVKTWKNNTTNTNSFTKLYSYKVEHRAPFCLRN
ncbi:hypothetical protein [Vibrio mytili]|uniref:hypothetical protein n=1 Tax=Vibrio mytili TaxID=50718 RepID=UPI000695BC97|nr:hypothetical protein [Vibrio mytili]